MVAEGVLEALRSRGQTLATAESLTGGRLAAQVTGVPGASAVFVGGVVTYATALKQELLGVPGYLIEQHGVVSAECASAMARGARDRLGADWAISTTGVAGPDRQEGRPPGTVFVGLAGPGVLTTVSLELAGSRHEVQDRTCAEALAALQRILPREEPGLR